MRQKDEGFIATSRPFIIIGPHSLPGKNKLSTTIKYFLYVFKLNLGRGRNKIFMVGNSGDNFTKLPCFYRTINNVLSILIKFKISNSFVLRFRRFRNPAFSANLQQ